MKGTEHLLCQLLNLWCIRKRCKRFLNQYFQGLSDASLCLGLEHQTVSPVSLS